MREKLDRHLQPEPPTSLVQLATTANHEHELCEQSTRTAVEHAIAAGEALLEARSQCEQGEWLTWLVSNFAGTQKAASNYMRLATYKDQLDIDKSIKSCLDLIRHQEPINPTGRSPHESEVREAAIKAVEGGAKLDDVAARVGVSAPTVWGWKNPAKRREQDAKAKARRRAATLALQKIEREKRINRAVRKAGAALAEAYSMGNRMIGVLAQAEQEVSTEEARRALERAGEHHRKMLDEIVSALGVS